MATEEHGEIDWLAKVQGLRVYVSGGQRAPHKPLLLLYALGRYEREGNAGLRYSECRKDLKLLVDTYNAKPTSEAYPFKHLANDGLWVVETDDGSEPQASPGWLERHEAVGFLAPDFAEALEAQPNLLHEAAWALLEGNFAPTLHNDILDLVGLSLSGAPADTSTTRTPRRQPRRDPSFRSTVMRAYEHRCAMCGWDAMSTGMAVGLEAAHVRGVFADGPNVISNGLSLCILHHKLFDLGMLGITMDRRVQVSEDFVARSPLANDHVVALTGRDLIEPQKGYEPPAEEHIAWHGASIFRGPARAA